MSVHTNADQSISDGIKVEAPGKFVSHQLGVAIDAAQTLTMPGAGETQAIVQADGQDVRFRLDGTAPTASVGILIKNGTSLLISAADAAAAKFIATVAGGKLNAWYTL